MVDTKNLIRKLDVMYGKRNGAKVLMTILPGTLTDFQKMLAATAPGKTISEEYRLEDGKGTLTLSGFRTASGSVEIAADLK